MRHPIGTDKDLRKKLLQLAQDNARIDTFVAAMAKFNETDYEPLPHPVCSSDPASKVNFLFPSLKKCCSTKRFGPNDEFISQTIAQFKDLDKSEYLKKDNYSGKRWISR